MHWLGNAIPALVPRSWWFCSTRRARTLLHRDTARNDRLQATIPFALGQRGQGKRHASDCNGRTRPERSCDRVRHDAASDSSTSSGLHLRRRNPVFGKGGSLNTRPNAALKLRPMLRCARGVLDRGWPRRPQYLHGGHYDPRSSAHRLQHLSRFHGSNGWRPCGWKPSALPPTNRWANLSLPADRGCSRHRSVQGSGYDAKRMLGQDDAPAEVVPLSHSVSIAPGSLAPWPPPFILA